MVNEAPGRGAAQNAAHLNEIGTTPAPHPLRRLCRLAKLAKKTGALMCGRFTLTNPNEAVAALFEAEPGNDLPPAPRYNICPTMPVSLVLSEAALGQARPFRRRLRAARWGFLPPHYKTPADGPLLINARAETLAEKPSFRQAARQGRCLIPASGFYEWARGAAEKAPPLPHYVTRADGALAALAGVCTLWTPAEGLPLLTYAIVTVAAGPDTAALHDRAPLALEPADWPLWLGEAGHGAARLMQPARPGLWAAPRRVSLAVNKRGSEGPELIAALESQDPGAF